jgi:hypothetical protein
MTCRPSARTGVTVLTANMRMLNRMNGGTRVGGRIVWFNEYCAAVYPHRTCGRSERVSGFY